MSLSPDILFPPGSFLFTFPEVDMLGKKKVGRNTEKRGDVENYSCEPARLNCSVILDQSENLCSLV